MNMGTLNFWIGRLMAQANKVITPMTYLMVLIQGLPQHPEFALTIPIMVLGTAGWYFIDTHKILEEELDYSYRRIPFLREISEDIKEIKEVLRRERE